VEVVGDMFEQQTQIICKDFNIQLKETWQEAGEAQVIAANRHGLQAARRKVEGRVATTGGM
jgi:hypothetical protein